MVDGFDVLGPLWSIQRRGSAWFDFAGLACHRLEEVLQRFARLDQGTGQNGRSERADLRLSGTGDYSAGDVGHDLRRAAALRGAAAHDEFVCGAAGIGKPAQLARQLEAQSFQGRSEKMCRAMR